MAFEEVPGGNSGEYEDREKVSMRIGAAITGTFRRMSRPLDSQYHDGKVRYVDIDREDGVKCTITADKILLERLEAAEPADGDLLDITIGKKANKSGQEYKLPRVLIDRKSGKPAPAAAAPVTPAPAAKPVVDDEPPF